MAPVDSNYTSLAFPSGGPGVQADPKCGAPRPNSYPATTVAVVGAIATQIMHRSEELILNEKKLKLRDPSLLNP